MKMNRRLCIFFFSLLLAAATAPDGRAQLIKTRLDLAAGLAYPEYIHGGIRYQYGPKGQAGIYYGGDMGFRNEIIHTFSLDHMFHFGTNNYFSNRPVWYLRQGFTYSRQLTNLKIYQLAYLEISAGYEFPLSTHIGINFDMGLNLKIRERELDRDPDGVMFIDPRWYPGLMARVQVYFSI